MQLDFFAFFPKNFIFCDWFWQCDYVGIETYVIGIFLVLSLETSSFATCCEIMWLCMLKLKQMHLENFSFFPTNFNSYGQFMIICEYVGFKNAMHSCWENVCVRFICVGMASDHGESLVVL